MDQATQMHNSRANLRRSVTYGQLSGEPGNDLIELKRIKY